MPRKVLLIDDDRMQFRLTQAHFSQFRSGKFELEWAESYDDGLRKLLDGEYAVCLLDYQLGVRDGLELIQDAIAEGCKVPIIFLTAETGGNVDLKALDAGALDYLVKGEINTKALERSVRYALKLGETLEALRKAATHDALTGLLNRREFERIFNEETERAGRFGRAFALVSLDVDHFKAVNDVHGHAVGDDVLRAVARRVSGEIRTVDRLARPGGEEFVVLLPEIDGTGALEVARRIVAVMNRSPVEVSNGLSLPITLSAGAASWPEHGADAPKLLLAADKALYAAKNTGRNRAVGAS